MQTNGGHLIKYLRKKNGVSQAQLAKKLFMSQGMLSNIEKGDAKLSITDFTAAFAALGVAVQDPWIVHLNEMEFEGYLQYKKIVVLLYCGETIEKLQMAYYSFAANPIVKYPSMNQFLSYISVIINEETEDEKKKLAALYAALRKTEKHFEDEKITQYRLNFSEGLLVHEIALTYARLGQPGNAIALLDGIVQNKDSLRTTDFDNWILLPRIYTDLAVLLMEAAEYERALPICESALAVIRESTTLWLSPRAAYLLGVCYHKLNKPEQEYMPLLAMAYYCALSFRQNDLADNIRKEYDVLC